jgi:hypothetical protein
MHQVIDPIPVTPVEPDPAERRGHRRLARWARRASVLGASLLGFGALAGPAAATTPYRFTTLDNENDPTFNQLLGINNHGQIAGYFGAGAPGHPNKGYLLSFPYGQSNYVNENFPGSTQTQVTGLNDNGVTVGFWSDTDLPNPTNTSVNANFGFYAIHGHHFHLVDFPTDSRPTPPVDQLLGVNNHNLAVGFYADANGNSHGYEYSIPTNGYRSIQTSRAVSVTAAAINNNNDIAGFETNKSGLVEGFLLRSNGKVTTLAYPNATVTNALGVNDHDEVVGFYQLGSGGNAEMHGFTWTKQRGFQTVDDPNGAGTTTINGVNNKGRLVGFYVDPSGNTDGMLATPAK